MTNRPHIFDNRDRCIRKLLHIYLLLAEKGKGLLPVRLQRIHFDRPMIKVIDYACLVIDLS